jgi:hypothetical protein
LAEIAAETSGVYLVANDPASLSRALFDPLEPRSDAIDSVRARFGLDRWVEEMSNLYAA